MKVEDELGRDNLAFVKAMREGVFAGLSPLELDAWNRLRYGVMTLALLPWYDGINSSVTDKEGYFKRIVYVGKTRY